jgi:ribosomal protein S18 acetylase RimI-like enzyme
VPSIELRALLPDDAGPVRALVVGLVERSPYGVSPRAALEGTLLGRDPDYAGIIALDGEGIAGVVLYGAIAGADGAGRLNLVAIEHGQRMRGVATMLIEAAIDALRVQGKRFVTVELPDDPELAQSKSLLVRCGFRLEARVPDYFRDGVDLAILRRDLKRG